MRMRDRYIKGIFAFNPANIPFNCSFNIDSNTIYTLNYLDFPYQVNARFQGSLPFLPFSGTNLTIM